MTLQETLGKRLIYLDGGMGTMLQAAGLRGGEVPESWNLSHPEAVKAVHRAYLDAGCDIVTTNTFGATSLRFGPELPAIIRAGVRLAKEATREAGHGWVAFDMNCPSRRPFLRTARPLGWGRRPGPTASSLKPSATPMK